MFDIHGRTAFITGAASGIGLGIARAMLTAGARVMLCDIDERALAAAGAELRAIGSVGVVRADVSVKAELQEAAAACTALFGDIHVLINNAGVVDNTDYGAWTDASWNWVMGVNLTAMIWGIEIFGPMIESHGEGGHIVCTTSVGGLYAGRHSAYLAYNVSKYGVVALCEGLRATLRDRGIGISALCPGMVRTQILEAARHLPSRFADQATGRVSTGELTMPAGMADAIAGGLDPDYVGELVVEGIAEDWPYIFTDLRFEPLIEERFMRIREGFDRIRDRTRPDDRPAGS